MKIIILFFAALILMGCGNPTPKVTPDQLPVGTSGIVYNAAINISGGYISPKGISVKIIPQDSGLTWSPKISYLTFQGKTQKDEDFHEISITGIPLLKGVIQIKIDGYTSGTMYAGKEFHKIYEIKVD